MSTETSDDKQRKYSERRSSVRVRSLLPCAVRAIEEAEIPALEARILDMAVIESDGALSDTIDWSERTDEMPREVIFVLNEIRALRQQITEVQRLVERQGEGGMEPRWVGINDRGLRFNVGDDDPSVSIGDYLEVRLRIPSIHNPDILAVGEVVRVDESEDRGAVAVEFRAISQMHKKAIIRYALRRERQLARSGKFPTVRDQN
jgi:c-di-GMP-binding flagellar brake protein YcgR